METLSNDILALISTFEDEIDAPEFDVEDDNEMLNELWGKV